MKYYIAIFNNCNLKVMKKKKMFVLCVVVFALLSPFMGHEKKSLSDVFLGDIEAIAHKIRCESLGATLWYCADYSYVTICHCGSSSYPGYTKTYN